jgi:hypothetical protein
MGLKISQVRQELRAPSIDQSELIDSCETKWNTMRGLHDVELLLLDLSYVAASNRP